MGLYLLFKALTNLNLKGGLVLVGRIVEPGLIERSGSESVAFSS
jgi:hypothetical protein